MKKLKKKGNYIESKARTTNIQSSSITLFLPSSLILFLFLFFLIHFKPLIARRVVRLIGLSESLYSSHCLELRLFRLSEFGLSGPRVGLQLMRMGKVRSGFTVFKIKSQTVLEKDQAPEIAIEKKKGGPSYLFLLRARVMEEGTEKKV
ncbi:hypothetical protein E5676_scaffold811G00150 [Cucumis melo var. makuwa]|uniref:Uncharacterized protein n=1 Tax=Cucumis melo var. makuwa TaxID=1194695 RepID=A0A5D3D8B9_CUCMM|nr:hypothetical protein E5676_scaffold811G00150 [Cucumis melo var. makuwa]